MKRFLVVILMAAVGIPLESTLSAQENSSAKSIDQEMQLLRKDLRSLRKQIVAANLSLTDTEAQAFWPVYDQYVAEVT